MIVSFSSHYGIVGILSFAILASCLQIQSARVLSEFILNFEPVFFDQHFLKDQHRRSVRSPMDRYFTLQFTAFKRVFRLKLKRDPWVFAENTKFENSNSTVQYDKARVLSGFVEGTENDYVEM
ncbi:disintegrin and metalloproteinase domain-containing protein 10 [Nephila pilipes]|uniref:Disintegrin and metalloproteinase domain-containing protein 10 n=1 Tax=Nephila pilipes TaxID=299642 RepID=A0A8X6NEU7_NEPPI|nr:disintegrin and metalloproteinase domain-containing protein 10 [Nephila pilipes]